MADEALAIWSSEAPDENNKNCITAANIEVEALLVSG